MPRLAVRVIAIFLIAAVGDPRIGGLAGVLVGAVALVEALLHVGLKKKGFGVGIDGDHGVRRATKADTCHRSDENVED